MKKLISMILVLLILTTSVSVLAPLASANTVEGTEKIVYAYQSTVTLDGMAGEKEPGLMVQNYFKNNIRFGAAWDYENVYFVFNGIDGMHIEEIHITVGTAAVSLTDNPAEGKNGDLKLVSYCGAEAESEYDCIEVAIPISEIVLNSVGDDIYAELGIMTVSKNGANTLEGKLMLSNRMLFFRNALYDGSGSMGKNGMERIYGEADGYGKYDMNEYNIKIKKNSDHSYDFLDAVEGATKVRIMAITQNLYRSIEPCFGGSHHADFEVNIESLPEFDGSLEIPEMFGQYYNKLPFILFSVGCRSDINYAMSTKLFIHNKKGEGLVLSIGFPDYSIEEIALADYGINFGEDFKFGVNVNGDNTLDLFINDALVKHFAKKAYSERVGSSSPGYLVVSAQRNYTFGEGEATKFTLKNVSLSTLTPINVDKVLSLSKNGGTAPNILEKLNSGTVKADGFADPFYGQAIKVGSLATMRAAQDTKTNSIALLFNIQSVGRIELDIGGKNALIEFKEGEQKYIDGYGKEKSAIALDAVMSGIDGATATVNKTTVSNCVEVLIPLSELALKKAADGLCRLDYEAKVSSVAAYLGSEDGVVTNSGSGAFLLMSAQDVAEVSKKEVLSNFNISSANKNFGLTQSGGNIIFNDTKLSTDKIRASATLQNVNTISVRQDIKISMEVLIDALPITPADGLLPEKTYDGWIEASVESPRLLFTVNRPNAAGDGSECICYAIYNTAEDGLVLVFSKYIEDSKDGRTAEIVKLGKKVGEAFALDVELLNDGRAIVYADNATKGEVNNAIAALGTGGAPSVITRAAGTFTVNFMRNRDLAEDEEFKATVSSVSLGNKVGKGNNLLPIELKYVQYSSEKSQSFDTRFISSINSLSYKKVGYELQVKGSDKVRDVDSSTVYTSFINGGEKITASDGEYFVILSEKDIPVSDETYTLIVRPYAIDTMGKTYYGTSFEIDYLDGKMVDNRTHSYVYYKTGDLDPFVGSPLSARGAGAVITLDRDKNSVIYDLGVVKSVNRAVLTSTNKDFAHFNKNSFALYYSDDNIEYKYVKEFSVLTLGNKVYFYNFDVDARYIKINSTANISFSEGKITNTIDNILNVYYSDKPLLAEDEFLMTTSVSVKNEKDVVANNTIFEFTLEDLRIDAADLKDDMSDIRFKSGGTLLPHYYSNGIFYVRVIKLEANEEAEITVLYNNETAESVSHGDEVFEIQYGTKYGWEKERGGWFNSVVTLNNGDLMEMIYSGGYLYYYRSENGGMTWSPMTRVEASVGLDIQHGGGFILDEKSGKVFYFAYNLKQTGSLKDYRCIYQIFVSEDNGYTWEHVGTPVGANDTPAPLYALSYSNGITLSKADGDGPNVDYVFTSGQCRNMEDPSMSFLAFCTTALYSRDGGKTWIFSDSKINYEFSDTWFSEGGLSEETVYEKEDGTLVFYARCGADNVFHFAKSYSYDDGVTWTDITEESFSNIYSVNTQPIIELTENGTPIFLWGGNNSQGARSGMRFPLNLAISYDDGETFVDLIDVSHQTVIAQLERLHTNPDMTFYNYGGMENLWIVSTSHKVYVLNSEDFLYKTKGAFDSFEDTAINTEGWLFASGEAYLSGVGATEGKQALRFAENSMGTRSIHYLEEGKLSFDLTVNSLGNGVDFELKTAYNDSRAVTAPVRYSISSDGELCYYDSSLASADMIGTGLKVSEGANTLTVEFNGNSREVTLTLNGESVEAAWIGDADNSVSFFDIFTSSEADISVDRFTVIRKDK